MDCSLCRASNVSLIEFDSDEAKELQIGSIILKYFSFCFSVSNIWSWNQIHNFCLKINNFGQIERINAFFQYQEYIPNVYCL